MTRPALRERFLETAARLAASDQEIAPEELQVLTRMAQRLQLEPGAVDRVVADVINSPKGSTALPTDRGERLALFHGLCEVAAYAIRGTPFSSSSASSAARTSGVGVRTPGSP